MTVKAISLRTLLGLGLLVLPALARAVTAAYPFPQNRAQPTTCYYPAYLNSDVVSVYNSWLSQQVTTTGAGGYRRVRRHGDPTLQADSTVSEGIGYGMIIAVYMNDQSLFDDLWRYYNLHLGGNGLMDWYISADGATVLGSGGASDADEDAAWALVMASYQWGTSSYGSSYATMAQALITKLWNSYVDGTSKLFGPWSGAGGNTVNISYFDPAQYRVFAQFTGNSGWLQVVDTCYTALFNSLKAANGNQNNGLVPAWSNFAGDPVPGFSGAPTHFQYDSCRTPFRIGKDWYFFGEPRAKQYLDKINSFYVPLGATHITDGYDLNGAPRPQYDASGTGANGQSAAFVSPAMLAGMDVPGQAAFVQDAYDAVKTNTLLIGGPYYDQSWTVMGMLWASGNYLNYMPTPTPTPTVDACQFRVRVNAGGTAQSGYSADQAYSTGGWGYVTAYAGAIGTSGGPVTGDPNSGLYLDERYDSSGSGEVRYSFSVPNGPVSVTLHWAETYFSSAGQRKMNVFINGTQVESNLDIYAQAGGKNIALIKTYSSTVSSGVLTIRFVTVAANATIHAIEVTAGSLCTATVSPTRTPVVSATATPTASPSRTISATYSVSPTGTPTPTLYPTPDACSLVRRVNAGGGAYTGGDGRVWAADQAYSAGSYGYVSYAAGTAATSAGPISGTTDDALFMAERYGGSVRYRFDLPNGPYQVTVRLAETYFDTAGNRTVTIAANGITELSQDLFTWAGGKNVAKDLTFTLSVSTGALLLDASSSNNNGTFEAIEVIGLNGCTATPTPPYTATVSPTRTATPSGTPSRSPSPSPTASATRSATASASPSPSSTGTPTASPSASPSASASLTASPSVSASFTRSPTPLPGSPTASPSLTASPSPSVTASPSPTLSASATASPPATFSATPSATRSASATASPSGTSSPTPSLSPSPTPSTSPSPTRSATVTFTLSLTASPSSSPSFTPVPTGSSETPTPTVSPTWSSSPSATPTASPSASPSQTPSASPSVTLTATLTSSLTASPPASASASPSPSPTGTWSVTESPTISNSPSATQTASRTRSPSATPTASASPGATLSATPSPGAAVTATPGPVPLADEPLRIEEHHAWPQPMGPRGGFVNVRVKGPVQGLRLRLYSRALVLVGTVDQAAQGPGWNRLDLGPQVWDGLGAGLYFYRVEALHGAEQSPPAAPGKILFLR